MVIYLRRRLPGASSGLPEGEAGHLIALLFGLAPGGVFQASPVTRTAGGLLHHRFTLTRRGALAPPAGGMLSVALSVGSPRLGVTQHPALWSPDFPRARDSPATTRPAQHKYNRPGVESQIPADRPAPYLTYPAQPLILQHMKTRTRSATRRFAPATAPPTSTEPANGRMGEWTNGRMGEWANGRMDEWTNGRMGEWTNGRMDEWTNGRMDEWTNEQPTIRIPHSAFRIPHSPFRIPHSAFPIPHATRAFHPEVHHALPTHPHRGRLPR